MAEENKEKQVDKILSDKDNIIDESEIRRIIRLYLARDASQDEISRFLNMKESERKILIDYANSEMISQKNQNELEMKSNKMQGDLAIKGIKAMGDNNLMAMKTGQPMQPPQGMGQMPMQTPVSQPILSTPQPSGNRFIPEGRFSLIKFQN